MEIQVQWIRHPKYAEVTVYHGNCQIVSGPLNEAEQQAFAKIFREAANDLSPTEENLDGYG